jgi:hypothetical protein
MPRNCRPQFIQQAHAGVGQRKGPQ